MASKFVATHTDKVLKAVDKGEAARSALVASWRRSAHLHRLDPSENEAPRRLTDHQLKEARQAIEPLLRVAQPGLDRLFQAVGGVGCSVLLADRNGVPVDRRGAAGDDNTFESWGLWTGTLWSENHEGTNGIGTCLVEQRALTIHRDQHFFARNALLSCTTAPIFDEYGELIAALDVSSCRADLTEDFVQLISLAVIDAAKRIETDNFRNAFAHARIVMASTPEHPGNVLLAVDHDDLVIGATRAARIAFNITPSLVTNPIPASDILGLTTQDDENLNSAERSAVQRALARAHGNVTLTARNLGISRATLHRKLKQLGLR